MIENYWDDLLKKDERVLLRIASKTLEWRDENKFSFIWDNQIVLVHYDRSSSKYTILVDLEDDIRDLLLYYLEKVLTPEVFEQENE